MTHRLRLIGGAALLVLVGAGAQLAVAQSSARVSASPDAAASKASPAPMAAVPMTIAPVSRPLDGAALPGRRDLIATLTKDECTGMGGVVGDQSKDMSCSSGRACYTASANGAIKGQCITE
jgi:hypothetical protein